MAAIAATVALLGGALVEREATPRSPVAETALLGDPSLGLAGDASAAVRRLEAQLEAGGDDGQTQATLGLAYLLRAQQLANPADYKRAERTLKDVLDGDPRSFEATSALASLAMVRHRFAEALRLGRRAVAIRPAVARTYGTVGDALLELGRYDEAIRMFDRMAALRPSHGSYARVSYARELLGDLEGAIQAMRLALGPAAGDPSATAWTYAHLGKLHFGRGELAAAAAQYRLALAVSPGDGAALDGLALVTAAQGRIRTAIALARRAADSAPVAQYATTLGDLLTVAGRSAEARQAYRRVRDINERERRYGVVLDLDTALFDLDRGYGLRAALEKARSGRAQRPSVIGDDVLAWALARNGRCEEALSWSKRALRLGTKDAAMFFHRGFIERCLGRETEARSWFGRALALNPQFSLKHAPLAREALR